MQMLRTLGLWFNLRLKQWKKINTQIPKSHRHRQIFVVKIIDSQYVNVHEPYVWRRNIILLRITRSTLRAYFFSAGSQVKIIDRLWNQLFKRKIFSRDKSMWTHQWCIWKFVFGGEGSDSKARPKLPLEKTTQSIGKNNIILMYTNTLPNDFRHFI